MNALVVKADEEEQGSKNKAFHFVTAVKGTRQWHNRTQTASAGTEAESRPLHFDFIP